MTVHTTWVGATAILSLDNPPVNAGNTAMRRDLRDALLAVRREPGLRAVVVESAGRHFYAGADIGEFDRPLEEPQLPAVIEVIEELEVPVVAAITGFALGGGLELALGCDARVGDTSAIVGFPEVTLGIIPGSGGTVRGGRLLGPAGAIDLVASGRHVAVDEALELGILDEVVEPEQLRDAAVLRAEGMGGKRRLRDLPGPEFDAAEVSEVEQRVSRQARPNVLDAIEMVKRGVEMPATDALREERAVFNRLRLGDESANLRYLFFAKRKAGAGLRTGAAPKRIERVGVAGAGTMGAAIVRLFDRSGYGVTVFDLDEDALRRVAESAPGIATTQRLADLADAGLVIDAVFEDMGVKQDLLSEIERVAPTDAILASNTSYLDLDEMSGVLQHPERFAGLHFFNPADRNPLIEVVRPARADDETIATLGALTGKLGKTAVLAGVGEGFVANRVYADYRAQAEFLLEEGASPEDVDAAMVDMGFPIGPFAVGDMSGLDIAWARRKRLSAHRDPQQRYVTIPDSLCESGRFGKKAGAGWYAYPEGASRGVPDARVTEIIEDARRAKGIAPREISGEEIQLRVVVSMLCAAAALLRDGIARQASDVDVAMAEGFGFPKRLGGPLRFAARLPEERLLHWLAVVHESDPIGFRIARHDGRIPEPIRRVLDEVTGA